MECFICKKHLGELKTDGITIYEDDFVFVGHIDNNGEPGYLGQLIIDLKRHVPTLGDMTEEEAVVFGRMMARVSKALMVTEGAEHIYSLVSGNSVPHLHMHIVLRYPGTPKQYWGPMSVRAWSDAPIGGNHEIIALCERVRSCLEKTNAQ
ncbi:HIT family protein [Sporosarcina luteola]|uniref:HIT family protein n=1 Tax=Sporosarcina luteola TaxID=582850 RepID=UPI0020411A80|nr:HIT family protein [Sporosarcina luteola]MCM3638086.1 HIT family protein [Sporosarcina luteola]